MIPLVAPERIAWSLPHIVNWSQEDAPTTCWGDRDGSARCHRSGTGRLGLCSEHELAILGEPERP